MNEGKYLLIINCGTEGYVIQRYKTKEELLEAIRIGETHSNKFTIAEELKMDIVRKDA